jgi:thioredoxin 1
VEPTLILHCGHKDAGAISVFFSPYLQVGIEQHPKEKQPFFSSLILILLYSNITRDGVILTFKQKEKSMNAPIKINDSDFEEIVVKSHLPVVVEFWSPGCGPCEMYVPVFEELASRYAGKILIAKYNVNENFLTVAKQYGVLGAPTILFMKKGKVVHRINGYLSIDLLKKEVAKFAGIPSVIKQHDKIH